MTSEQSEIETQNQIVPDHLAGQRLDLAMARMFPDYSRSRIKSWIQSGRVTVDGASLRPRDSVMAGATISLRPEPDIVVRSDPQEIQLDIRFEDDDVLIINKPVGLVVHPGAGNHRGTLMNGLLYHEPRLSELPRAGIVHRLDKDTSGLMMVAKSLPAHTSLVRQLADREIVREYLAVCTGVLTGGGKIDAPIGRHPVDRLRMHVTNSGRPAITHYRVIQRFAAHTYISVRLETGRTHQIRVHFAHRRHPLVGDLTYGGRLGMPAGASEEVREILRVFRRQALHAHMLGFMHPVSGEAIEVKAELPDDFQHLVEVLGGIS